MQSPMPAGNAGAADSPQHPTSQINTAGGNYIGGDVTTGGGDFVSRDKIIQYFLQPDYTSLRDLYVPPDAVYERVRSREFVGRSWLIAQIDDFLHDPKRRCGVLVLEGEAGVGKSALMAHLVQRRNYLHLFAEQLPGDANVGRALQSLGSQIVTVYQLQEYTQRDTLPAISGFPDFLERLLRGAAVKLPANREIVIVCDALDEAGVAANGNVFGLPQVLPEGVYLLLSQRPQPVALNFKNTTPQILRLDPASNENRGDVQAYLRQAARQPEIAPQLAERGYSAERFVTILAERSGGVWMYLQYVIDEIARGERAPLDLDRLPPGLAGYYADYWSRWREGKRGEGKPAWRMLYAPLLTTLAAAHAPIPFSRLLQWAGVDLAQHDRYELQDLLAHQWHAFVTEVRREANTTSTEPSFSLYHASLRDFLSGKVATHHLLPAAHALVDELHGRTLDAHVRIVEALRQQCAGEWVKLVDDGYARLHLASHLHAASERNTAWYQELYTLVAGSDNWAKAREAAEESYNGYLVDLNLLWQHANSDAGWNVGTQLRCALIQSSIFSLADNLTPELVALAVETNIWSTTKAMAYLSQIQDEEKRCRTLIQLFPHLTEALKAEALLITRSITNEDLREDALNRIASYLPLRLKPNILAMAAEITSEHRRISALCKLAPHLPESLRENAIGIAKRVTNSQRRASALSGLVPYFSGEMQAAIATEAFELTKGIANEIWRANGLSVLAPYLPDNLKGDALMVLQGIKSDYRQASIITRFAPFLLGDLKQNALNIARKITDPFSRIHALTGLAAHLPKDLQMEVINEAYKLAWTLSGKEKRASALCWLVPYFPEDKRTTIFKEVMSVVRNGENDYSRLYMLTGIVSHLPERIRNETITEILAMIRSTTGESRRVQELKKLASYVPKELIPILLEIVSSVTDESKRTSALSGIVPFLPPEMKADALEIVKGLTDESILASAIGDLALQLPTELQVSAVQIARGFSEKYWCAFALSRMALHLPEKLKFEVIHEALAVIRLIADERWVSYALINITSNKTERLDAGIINEILTLVRSVHDARERVEAMNDLLKYLPEEFKVELDVEALETTSHIPNNRSRAEMLIELAPHLREQLLSNALKIAHGISDDFWRIYALTGLLPHLPKKLRIEIVTTSLETTRELRTEYLRAYTLSSLIPYLKEEEKAKIIERILDEIQWIKDEYQHLTALTVIGSHLPKELKVKVINDAYQLMLEMNDEDLQAMVLYDLAPFMLTELQIDAYEIVKRMEVTTNRVFALIGLVPYLSDQLKSKSVPKLFESAISLGILDWGNNSSSSILHNLITAWVDVHFDGFLPQQHWTKLLSLLAHNPRPKLLADLTELTPMLAYLDGKESNDELLRAIRDVVKWWS